VTEGELLASLAELTPAAERLRLDLELRPSFFDVCTALALLIFRRTSVDAAVVEVGLGGRLDSTNVVEPSVSVLTSIQLEHTDKLGGTLAAIAEEKAGIFRPGVPILHGPLPMDALSVVLGRAAALDVTAEEVRAHEVEMTDKGVRFSMDDGRCVRAPVFGRHQATNLALAVCAAEHLLGKPLSPDQIAALQGLRLPARQEWIGGTVLDSAHTPDSARALRETLQTLHPARRVIALVSISKDKDAAGILQELAPVTRRIVLCRPEPLRSLDPGSLEPLAWACGIEEVEVVPEPASALARAREALRPGEILAVSGSFYLAGALRPLLLTSASAVDGPARLSAAETPT
jgi:dihydrofolate synthase/folylpolyglutamate synthase